tara:strand:+ start:493 stop:765 length:273 start_codon:yes stop_codon:yes gene_type:complete
MIFFGFLVIKAPNLVINFSIILGCITALELGSHLINEMRAGSIVRDKTQAQKIPNASVIPYPFIPFRGEKISDKKANAVVIDVSEIGKNR